MAVEPICPPQQLSSFFFDGLSYDAYDSHNRSAGFIGFHLSRLLVEEGFKVVGVDSMTSYYDVALKQKRHAMLRQSNAFSAEEFDILDHDRLLSFTQQAAPDAIVHLAAQAGVRYSLEHPRAYIDTNVTGTFNVMECARELKVSHLLMASTSSVYGANEDMPFGEMQKVDTPLTIYAATKKANEVMGHSYAHLWGLPTTMFRFFTVYGPVGPAGPGIVQIHQRHTRRDADRYLQPGTNVA
jgi:UDP-glucuronate 4-epimerase